MITVRPIIVTDSKGISQETKKKIKLLVEEEMKRNGYKRDEDIFVIEMRKVFRSFGIEPKF